MSNRMATLKFYINAGIPVALYLPGAVYIVLSDVSVTNTAPRFPLLFLEPFKQTFELSSSVAGFAGALFVTLLAVVWLINWIDQMTRGMPA